MLKKAVGIGGVLVMLVAAGVGGPPRGEGAGAGPEVAVTVLAGKRFVLEDVSGLAFLPPGQKLIQASVSMPNGQVNSPELDFSPTFNGPSGAIDLWAFGRAARGYADTSVLAFARRN